MEIDDLKEIQVGEPIDLTEFEGIETTIDRLDVKEVPSIYTATGKAMCLLVESVPITTVEIDGKDVDIRASELFNLKQEEDGSWGWSSSSRSKLQQFMRKLKAKTPKELINKKVRTRLREKTNADGTSVQFLGFVL
jgi:hypothetical protein